MTESNNIAYKTITDLADCLVTNTTELSKVVYMHNNLTQEGTSENFEGLAHLMCSNDTLCRLLYRDCTGNTNWSSEKEWVSVHNEVEQMYPS